MSEKINDGGQAFPLPLCDQSGQFTGDLGMTLRDYFAAKALMSMLSPVQDITGNTPDHAAEWSYKFADAMLRARGEK